MNEDVDKFLKKYESTGELSRHKMYAKRPQYVHGRIYDYNPYETTASFQIEREPYVEINMPQHRFRDLVERERYLAEAERDLEYYKKRYLESVEEDSIRHRNPAVKKAYERYRLLLELVRK